jgi:hypothetical protein
MADTYGRLNLVYPHNVVKLLGAPLLKSCGLTTTLTGDHASQMPNIAIVVRIFMSAGNPSLGCSRHSIL